MIKFDFCSAYINIINMSYKLCVAMRQKWKKKIVIFIMFSCIVFVSKMKFGDILFHGRKLFELYFLSHIIKLLYLNGWVNEFLIFYIYNKVKNILHCIFIYSIYRNNFSSYTYIQGWNIVWVLPKFFYFYLIIHKALWESS